MGCGASSRRAAPARRAAAPAPVGPKLEATNVAAADRIFRSIDVDSSGTVELSELHEYLLKKMNVMPSQVQTVLEGLDVDGDGKISIDEWREGWASYAQGSNSPSFKSSKSPSNSFKRFDPHAKSVGGVRSPMLRGSKAASAKERWLQTFLALDPRRHIVD